MPFDLFDKATDKAMDADFDKKDPTIQELLDIASPKEKALLEALIAKCEGGEKDKDKPDDKAEKPDDKGKAPPFGKDK